MTNPDRGELVKLESRIQYELAACETLVRAPTMLFSVDDLRLILRRLASSDGGVKVLELGWGPYPNSVFASDDVAVAGITMFGGHKYQVQRDPNAVGYIAYLAPQFGTLFWESKGHLTIEAAKAAAQADYEARIRAALVEVPAVKGEPVAWRWRDHSKGVLAPFWQYGAIEPDTYSGREVEPLYTAPPTDAGMREALENGQHYLGAIRQRLERLYEENPSDPRLREQLSDEVDWVNALYEALTAPGATTKSDGGHGGQPYASTDAVEGASAPNATSGIRKPNRHFAPPAN